MKTINFLRAAILLIGILLSACAPAANSPAPANVGGGKPLSEVVFTGVIESMNGDQWTINGQSIKVDSSVLRDGPFVVGDTVKVEASVAEDGSVIAQRVETPSAADLVEATTSTLDSSSSLPGVSSTPQAPASNDNSNNNGNEAFGTVDAVTDTSITVDGQTFTFASGVEIKGEIVPGAVVKLHFMVNADGTLSVREIEIANPTLNGNNNSNDDNSNGNSNSNDDDSNDDNSNSNSNDDDDSNDDNSNSNSNDDDDDHDDDNSNDSNSNG